MHSHIAQIEHLFKQHLNLSFSSCTKDEAYSQYEGHSCQLDSFSIKYRKAKITPKKIGQFVTLWQRNIQGFTQPFHLTDPFDFYIIAVQQEDYFGIFFFPRQVLGEKKILTTTAKEGKRGFRVYPDWDIPTNKQALQTQQWQKLYFIDLSTSSSQAIAKIKRILLHQ